MAYTDYLDTVQKIYIGYYERPADSAGLLYWAARLDGSGGNLNEIIEAFASSAESQTLHGTIDSSTISTVVDSIYSAFFNRTPDAAGKAFYVDGFNAGTFTAATIMLNILNGATGLDATSIANKLTAANMFTSTIDPALDTRDYQATYSGDTDAAQGRTYLSTVDWNPATLPTQSETNVFIQTNIADAGDPLYTATTGQTFTLTTNTDNITGTSGDDTVIGDFGAGTLQASDQIAGGSGTDTLKMYGTYAAGNMPLNITGVETLDVVVAADAALDFSAYTKAVAGVEHIVIENATAINGKAITTTAGQSLSLATGSTSAVTAGTVTWIASATDTSLNLTLNGYQAIAGGVPSALTITGAAATTLNIASTGGANKTGTLTGPTTVNSHVITGTKALTYATAAADTAALNSINASGNTGGTNVNMSAALTKAAFTFTGGTGNDSIKFIDNEFGTLTAGTQLVGGDGTDKIGILDTALTAAETAKINAATGFEVLGLNAAITLDASTLTSIKSFSIDTTALTQTINNMATGSTATITAAAPTSLTLAGATGVSDMTVALGTSSSTGNITVGTLVTTGMTNVTMSSNGTGTHTNTITTLTNSDNSVFTLSGTQQLTMSLATGTAIGSKVDGTAMTGALLVTGSNGAGYGDILIGGTAADTITGRSGADKVTGGAAADTFVFSGAAGANTNGATFGTYDEITDFVAGTDKLQFSNVVDVVSAQQAAVQTAVTALAAGSTAAQIAAAMAGANTTNLGVSFATFEGNSYCLFETTGAGAGVVADDVFIKLTGVTTVPTFAADVIA